MFTQIIKTCKIIYARGDSLLTQNKSRNKKLAGN